MLFQCAGVERHGEAAGWPTAGGQQASWETEERAHGRIQEAAQTDRHTQTTEGGALFYESRTFPSREVK